VLSAYNTGHFEAGLRNGYVARYLNGSPAGAAAAPHNPYTADTRVPLDGPEDERVVF
jgi:hypothetical protein